MSLLQEITEIKASPKELKKFGITIGIFILCIAAFLFYKQHLKLSAILLGFDLVVLGTAIFKPADLIHLHKGWMSVAVVLSWIMTRIILGILFYVGFTLIKIIAKIAGKEFLDLKIDKSKSSYWIKREPKEFDPLDYERQF